MRLLPVSLGCVSDSAVYATTAAVNDSNGAMDNACCGERPQAGLTHTDMDSFSWWRSVSLISQTHIKRASSVATEL
jgi:hypothetical protein